MTNARFEDLEKRVKSIKLKKQIKLFIFVCILIGLGIYLYGINQPPKVLKPADIKKVEKQKEIKKVLKVKKFEPVKKEIKEKVIIEKQKNDYDTIKLSPKIDFFIETKQKNIVKNTSKKIKKEPVTKKHKISLHVKVVKSEEALLERFGSADDFESAMGLAYLYFEKKNFEKSIYWSKKASKLTPSEDSSWIIYAKSKKSIGKTDDAIKALQLYLEYFSSNKIKKLLKLYRNKK